MSLSDVRAKSGSSYIHQNHHLLAGSTATGEVSRFTTLHMSANFVTSVLLNCCSQLHVLEISKETEHRNSVVLVALFIQQEMY